MNLNLKKIYILYDKMRNIFIVQNGSSIDRMQSRFEILTSPSGIQLASFNYDIIVGVMKDLIKECNKIGSHKQFYNDKNKLIKFIIAHQDKFK